MNIQTFLEHHGIVRNPFAEEDAQTDQVFKEHCISSAYHPIWDKVYGDPVEPSTAMIFGPKGSGKTAIRLQIDRHLQQYNKDNPDKRVFIIRYDDFNPFLDHFCERMNRRTIRKPEKVLDAWKLWDHMDAIMCLGVTQLVDEVLSSGKAAGSSVDRTKLKKLDRTASRDLLLLAASYDQSTESSFAQRWKSLRKKLRYGNFAAKRSRWFAILWTLLVIAFFAVLFLRPVSGTPAEVATPDVEARVVADDVHLVSLLVQDEPTKDEPVADEPAIQSNDTSLAAHFTSANNWLNSVFGDQRPRARWLFLAPLLILLGALPYLIRLVKCHLMAVGIRRHMRVGKREVGPVRRVLQRIPGKELASQPLPRFDRTDDRYELLNKFQSVLDQLGFSGTIVLMDRVDEPHMTGGKPELMRRFVWPLLDNKLLKHPGLGFKMMLPQELHRDMERESREFHERARLDKQNVIPAFQWTGEALYDLARARMIACAADGKSPEPKILFDQDLDYQRLLSAFRSLRVPRHLFRFLYRVLVDHCNRYTDAEPEFLIKAETFETILAVYSRESDPTSS